MTHESKTPKVVVEIGVVFTCPTCGLACSDQGKRVADDDGDGFTLSRPDQVMCGGCLGVFEVDGGDWVFDVS